MKRILISLFASMLVAAGAQAATITVSTDAQTYNVGDNIVLTATLVADGGESVAPFQSYAVNANFTGGLVPANSDQANSVFGSGTQMITAGPAAGNATLSGTNGPLSGAAASGCSNNGVDCLFLTQVNASGSFQTVTLDGQTLVATLVLSTTGAGPGLLTDFLTVEDQSTAPVAAFVNNLGGVQIVPEPGTALLMGLGLLGLGFAGRRR